MTAAVRHRTADPEPTVDPDRDDAEPAVAPPSGPGRRRLLVPLLAVVAALGLVGTAGFAWAWNGERADDAARAGMASTARDFLVALTNFDGATVDRDFDAIVGYATGDFAAEADRFFGSDVRAALKEVQAASRGEIRSLYVQDFTGDRGRVFAVVDQTIANNRFPAPQADELRLDLGLQRSGGSWMVYDVKVLQAPLDSVAAQAAGGEGQPSSDD
ncbi:MAG TPA: hypothetical protein VGB14_02900 [Acidimicrobiales bacterium]